MRVDQPEIEASSPEHRYRAAFPRLLPREIVRCEAGSAHSLRLLCSVERCMGNFQEHQQDCTGDAPSSVPTVQTPRRESDVASTTQRIRNAAALVRAQQKVARERLRPVRQPK